MNAKSIHLLGIILLLYPLPVFAQLKAPIANPYQLGMFAGSRICGEFADMDADGDQDLIVSDLTKKITFVIENTGSPKAPAFKQVKSYAYAVPNFDLADLDYDGDIDIIAWDPATQLFFWRQNIGAATAFRFKTSIGAGNYPVGDYTPFGLYMSPADYIKPEMMDLDGDSFLDCIATTYNKTSSSSFVYDLFNVGKNFPAYTLGGVGPFHLLLPQPGQASFIESTDFDGDGDTDVFYGLANGALLYAENQLKTKPPFFSEAVKNPFGFTPQYDAKTLSDMAINFVDIDDDGDQDLFVFNGNGDVVFYESSLKRPPAPTGLTATAASSTTIQLAWTDNSLLEDGFIVQRSTDGTTFTQIFKTSANVVTYEDQSLTPGQKYYYKVIASQHDETSEDSNIASATTPSEMPPAAPLNLQGNTQGESAISLTWIDASDDEEGFGIERWDSAANAFVEIARVTGNTYNDVNVTFGQAYQYRVFAYKGSLKSYTNTVQVNFTNHQPPPVALDIPTLFTPDGDAYNPTWNILNLQNYSDHTIEVFDTSGKKVFSSMNYTPETEWDGTHNGKLLPSGTYIYIIKLNNGQQVNKGFVTLLHQ